METNKIKNCIAQWIIPVILILLCAILFVALFNHCKVTQAILKSSSNITYYWDQMSELKEIKNKIMNESSISFLTTIVIVLLVSVGIYFMQKNDDKIKEIENRNMNLVTTAEKLQKNDQEQSYKTLNQTQTLKLHIPISYIYSCSAVWSEKKIKREKKDSLIIFFFKIEKQIEQIKNIIEEEKNKKIKLDNTIKQMLTINYLEDSIANIENIITDNDLWNWEAPKRSLDDLKEIQEKINTFEKTD